MEVAGINMNYLSLKTHFAFPCPVWVPLLSVAGRYLEYLVLWTTKNQNNHRNLLFEPVSMHLSWWINIQKLIATYHYNNADNVQITQNMSDVHIPVRIYYTSTVYWLYVLNFLFTHNWNNFTVRTYVACVTHTCEVLSHLPESSLHVRTLHALHTPGKYSATSLRAAYMYVRTLHALHTPGKYSDTSLRAAFMSSCGRNTSLSMASSSSLHSPWQNTESTRVTGREGFCLTQTLHCMLTG